MSTGDITHSFRPPTLAYETPRGTVTVYPSDTEEVVWIAAPPTTASGIGGYQYIQIPRADFARFAEALVRWSRYL